MSCLLVERHVLGINYSSVQIRVHIIHAESPGLLVCARIAEVVMGRALLVAIEDALLGRRGCIDGAGLAAV